MCTHRDGKGVRITPSDSVTVTQTSRAERSKFEYRFGNVDLKQVVPYCVADEPWAFIRTVFFSLLTDNENGIWNDCRKVPDPEPDLELCAVCPALLKFLRYEEIPLDLLRFALGPRTHITAGDNNVSFAEFITKRVFNSVFAYERNGVKYTYTSGADRTF
jgi:hypothetical protein